MLELVGVLANGLAARFDIVIEPFVPERRRGKRAQE